MTKPSDYTKAWRLLRSKCHLSHYQVRAIFREHLGGLSFHRNLIQRELKREEAAWEKEAEAFALMLNSDDYEEFANRLHEAVWDGDDPQLSYVLVRLVDKRVREWNGWGELQRQHINERVLRRLARYEKRTGLRAWTDRHLLTYLHINGVHFEAI